MPRIKCPHCKAGIIRVITVNCPVCEGKKGRFVPSPDGKLFQPCENCAGIGWRYRTIRCEWCNGAGWLDA